MVLVLLGWTHLMDTDNLVQINKSFVHVRACVRAYMCVCVCVCVCGDIQLYTVHANGIASPNRFPVMLNHTLIVVGFRTTERANGIMG